MIVGLDAGPLLDPPTGVGRYVRELSSALEAMGVEVRRYAVALRGEGAHGIKRLRLPARLAQESWRLLGWPSIKGLVGDVEVVHGTNFVLPPLRGAAGVLTVHDLSFHRDDAFPGAERLRTLVPWSVERAARVLVPTRAVADEVTERFGLGNVTVTHEGVAPLFFGATPLSEGALRGFGITPPFAVAVGTIEPRKNLARLLDAWTLAGESLAGWTLVLAGPKGWGPELPERPGVLPIGWVGDETLPGLLAAAGFFCYPSLYEGFGLPPLEAMAAGTPALVGRYPCAEEVLGDAALIVDPQDVEALTEGLVRLAGDDDLRARLARSGKARAALYTWESTAAATLAAYKRAVA